MAARLNVGDTHPVAVDSQKEWNPAGVAVQPGEVYEIDVPPNQKWFDATIENTPDGSPPHGLAQRLAAWAKRKRDANYFALIAATGRASLTVVPSGTHEFRPQQAGDLEFFANDVPGFYKNNSGTITLTIRRTQ